MSDWGLVYADCVTAIIDVADGLTPEQLAVTVPATPAWTVHEVLAHSAGAPADALAGRMDGAPTPAWTGRHVAERADASVADLVAELRATAAAAADSVRDNPRPALVWDKAVHLADLHEALGLGAPAEHTWADVLDGVAGWRLAELPLTVQAGQRTWGAGGDEVVVTPYELFRALFSRRSRAQIRAWAGPGPTDDELDAVPVFGPREDDQPQP
jgi:hypothetical protein